MRQRLSSATWWATSSAWSRLGAKRCRRGSPRRSQTGRGSPGVYVIATFVPMELELRQKLLNWTLCMRAAPTEHLSYT